MNSDRFDRRTRTLLAPRSRRAIGSAVIGVALGAVSSPTIVRANCRPDSGRCPGNRHAELENGICICVCDHEGPGGICCAGERLCASLSCARKGHCCPDERACHKKVHGEVQTTCVSSGCCPGERVCPEGGCVDEDGCCPNERACHKKVHGKVRTTCIPFDQCCPNDEPCPAASNGCCNTIGGEQCTQVDGCCDVGGENKQVCAGKWCCDEQDDCDPVEGCVPTCDGMQCDGECCPGANKCCGNICCYGEGPCLSGVGCCHDADAFWRHQPDGTPYCCLTGTHCCSTGGPQCCL